MEEIKALYDEARSATIGIKKLVQLLNVGKFVVSCTISWVEFPIALCDTVYN